MARMGADGPPQPLREGAYLREVQTTLSSSKSITAGAHRARGSVRIAGDSPRARWR